MPTATGEDHVNPVGGCGDGSFTHADLTYVEGGVAVQGEDARDALEHAVGHQLQRSPGHDFLGRLKDQSHAVGQRLARVRFGQRHGRADERRHVNVVTARVGHTGNAGLPRVL